MNIRIGDKVRCGCHQSDQIVVAVDGTRVKTDVGRIFTNNESGHFKLVSRPTSERVDALGGRATLVEAWSDPAAFAVMCDALLERGWIDVGQANDAIKDLALLRLERAARLWIANEVEPACLLRTTGYPLARFELVLRGGHKGTSQHLSPSVERQLGDPETAVAQAIVPLTARVETSASDGYAAARSAAEHVYRLRSDSIEAAPWLVLVAHDWPDGRPLVRKNDRGFYVDTRVPALDARAARHAVALALGLVPIVQAGDDERSRELAAARALRRTEERSRQGASAMGTKESNA